MEIDVAKLAGAVTREVVETERDGKAARTVVAERTYDAGIDDVWDAITNPERIPRWFLPVTGDLRVGGRYQTEGNAGGTILRCDEPGLLSLTWEYNDDVSWLDVHLESVDDGTTLRLEHTAHVSPHWEEFGPGAVGVGWDMALLGLGQHLDTGESISPEEGMAWATSDNGKSFITAASESWGQADIAGGEDETRARAAAERTRQAYTGEGHDGSGASIGDSGGDGGGGGSAGHDHEAPRDDDSPGSSGS